MNTFAKRVVTVAILGGLAAVICTLISPTKPAARPGTGAEPRSGPSASPPRPRIARGPGAPVPAPEPAAPVPGAPSTVRAPAGPRLQDILRPPTARADARPAPAPDAAEIARQVDAMLRFPHRANGVMLAYDENTAPEDAAEINQEIGASLARHFGALAGGRMFALDLDGSLPLRAALLRLISSGLVAYAEPDYLLFGQNETGGPATDDEPSNWDPLQVDAPVFLANVPNDYSASTLYGMAKVAAPAAWDSLPTPQPGDPTVIVAVIDTGVRYTHEDLAANMWINSAETPGNGIDDDGNGYVDDVHGINAITGSGNPNDDNGHGTHCAGTIGAVGNNGKGVAGVAWKVNLKLMALKFLPASGGGLTSDAIECIEYAVSHGAHVLSNSWGGPSSSTSLSNAIEHARSNGRLIVAAAGNTSTNNDSSPNYPSSYTHDNIIAVASSDSADKRSTFSSYGRYSVDVFAPGTNIYSTHHASDAAYTTMSGTSMATPLVAGIVATLKVVYPGEDYLQLRERLLSTVDMPYALYSYVGTDGRANLSKALSADLSFREDALLWQQSSTGRICQWSMNGASLDDYYVLAQRVVGWQLKAAVDMDGDGERDLVFFRTSDGSICLWTMEGTTRRSFVVLANKAKGWNLVGTGNFDADPGIDFVWQHPVTGQVCIWYMRGTTLHSYSILNATVQGWYIASVRDDNQDGNLEIYWHNPSTGQICRWFMSGLNLGSYDLYSGTVKGWVLREVRDFDGDGKLDLRWYQPTTGQLCTWFMDGLNMTSYAVVSATAKGWEYVPMP